MDKKTYLSLIDIPFKNRFWLSGRVRKLNDEEAKPLIESEAIVEHNPVPKRWVIIKHPDGASEKMSWGDYLKYRNSLKKVGNRKV